MYVILIHTVLDMCYLFFYLLFFSTIVVLCSDFIFVLGGGLWRRLLQLGLSASWLTVLLLLIGGFEGRGGGGFVCSY